MDIQLYLQKEKKLKYMYYAETSILRFLTM
jgi:hypothetical protein